MFANTHNAYLYELMFCRRSHVMRSFTIPAIASCMSVRVCELAKLKDVPHYLSSIETAFFPLIHAQVLEL